MSVEALFTQALGLDSPWEVLSFRFDPKTEGLELELGFKRGSRFPDPRTEDPAAAELCPVHDTVARTWEHLNFFEHRTHLTAKVPRIKAPDGKVLTAAVPWARPQSGFTLLMEAFLLGLARSLPVAEVARRTKVTDDRIWHLIRTRVEEEWKKTDWSNLNRLGIDETSTRKGHKYGTAFLEVIGQETSRCQGGSKVGRLLFFTPGKGKETTELFAAELKKREIPPAQITEIAMDMSPAFIAGAKENFPGASISFDRFHVMKLCGDACDTVRKDVAKTSDKTNAKLPRGAMWSLRGNPERLKEDQLALRKKLCQDHRQIGRALAIREFLADLWNYATADLAGDHLSQVISWCQRSRLPSFVKLGRSLRSHREGILGYFKNYTTSGAIEAVNLKLQLARRRARGYRRFENFRAIAYWIAGGLELGGRKGSYPGFTH